MENSGRGAGCDADLGDCRRSARPIRLTASQSVRRDHHPPRDRSGDLDRGSDGGDVPDGRSAGKAVSVHLWPGPVALPRSSANSGHAGASHPAAIGTQLSRRADRWHGEPRGDDRANDRPSLRVGASHHRLHRRRGSAAGSESRRIRRAQDGGDSQPPERPASSTR